MSKSVRTRKQPKFAQGDAPQKRDQAANDDEQRSPQFLPPLRPSRKRLAVSVALLALWLGFLLSLFFTTVFPQKAVIQTQHQSVPQVAPPEGTVPRP
jgi:hypothetical protein